ncbi:type IV pilin-like G/H family protein [Gloeocapsopsis sp. IPPAS B-1203]|uniref:type IV pilin-like G/H family protein n=1 Tax=Gloeocapsopsis sp. IPPAS B-1203 TaxID=2049454 RepID=UPI000C17D3C1|nr:type IV pilin-like G/H family protein [Gloeocapsopsis sp. IPPAS B-1203]PIG95471.1 general secretion pathway protein GspH [Gloeocapsopsis sp. IPPAS B-1203]
MKAELKAKLLKNLNPKNQDQGFTLIELLVVIIIIGILSVIALPTFLKQAAKARQSEAKNNVDAMNRSQQVYYLENQTFTEDINMLSIGISSSNNYSYFSVATADGITSGVANKAKALESDLKGYAGGVFRTAGQTTQTIMCEVLIAGTDLPESPNSGSACDAATQTRMK